MYTVEMKDDTCGDWITVGTAKTEAEAEAIANKEYAEMDAHCARMGEGVYDPRNIRIYNDDEE